MIIFSKKEIETILQKFCSEDPISKKLKDYLINIDNKIKPPEELVREVEWLLHEEIWDRLSEPYYLHSEEYVHCQRQWIWNVPNTNTIIVYENSRSPDSRLINGYYVLFNEELLIWRNKNLVPKYADDAHMHDKSKTKFINMHYAI